MSICEKECSQLDIVEIKKRIPHRYPFLFVDKVLSVDLDEGVIIAVKSVTTNEPFFQGHFPDLPIMPGVLIAEALAQVAAIFVYEKGVRGLKLLTGINNFKFRRPVVPGDTLLLKLDMQHVSALGGKCKAVASVDGKVCAEGQLAFTLIKEKAKENKIHVSNT